MSAEEDEAVGASSSEVETDSDASIITVTIGATVPTGFEMTAVEEVQEKIGVDAKISKDRGRIYFKITTDKLSRVHHLKSVDNLFVVVEEFDNYQFKKLKVEALEDFMQLASKLPWANALEVWRLNKSLKKKRSAERRRRAKKCAKGKLRGGANRNTVETERGDAVETVTAETEKLQLAPEASPEGQGDGDANGDAKTHGSHDLEDGTAGDQPDPEEAQPEPEPEAKVVKFRVTCNRAGDKVKHSFSSNEAARDFGGAVQDFFQWKADMTKFDIEVLLNIHDVDVVIGIALTEESLHRRNITHFGPTTLRSTLCYGMLSLCKPQAADVIVDPMCGTGAIPLEGAIEWPQAFYIAGDNNDMAVSRTVNNISHHLKKRLDKGSSTPGLPIDTVQWDLCNLPMRTSSVDIIITDMPFGKRMGSWKKNWDLYPNCLREMARALSRMGGLWKKHHTVWVNVGGLHAGVYLLKRTEAIFGQTPEDDWESPENSRREEKQDQGSNQ